MILSKMASRPIDQLHELYQTGMASSGLLLSCQASIYEVAIELYDKSSLLAWVLLLIFVSTPVLLGWLSYLKKKEETNLEKFKHITNLIGKKK